MSEKRAHKVTLKGDSRAPGTPNRPKTSLKGLRPKSTSRKRTIIRRAVLGVNPHGDPIKGAHRKRLRRYRDVKRKRREEIRLMTNSLFKDGSIETGYHKAVEVKQAAQSLISRAESSDVSLRRIALDILRNENISEMRLVEARLSNTDVRSFRLKNVRHSSKLALDQDATRLEIRKENEDPLGSRSTIEMQNALVKIVDVMHGESGHARRLKASLAMADDSEIQSLWNQYTSLTIRSGELKLLVNQLAEERIKHR